MIKYVGDGSALVGIPARDLSAKEVKQHGKKTLLDSGLYREIKKKGKKSAEPKVTE